MNLTDKELQIQLNKPDQKAKAFSAVVRAYQERLYWHIRKMVLSHDDANDVLQNWHFGVIETLRITTNQCIWRLGV